MGNRDFFYRDLAVSYFGHHHGDFLVKTPGTAGAGIQPEYAVFFLLQVFVGVTEHNHVYAGKVRGNFLFVVDHKKGHPAQCHGKIVGKVRSPIFVIVAPDDVKRCILLQFFHNVRFVDVAPVEDGVRVFYLLQHLGTQQSMGVGQNGKSHVSEPPVQDS